MSCSACNKPILPGDDTTRAHGQTFHPGCFKCGNCKSLIKGAFFYEKNQFVCTDCSQGETDKRCASCNLGIAGPIRAFKGRNYCVPCVTRLQKEEAAARKAALAPVAAEVHRVDAMNERLAHAPKSGEQKKFDYKERAQWEKEERQKAGIPEPERKW